MSYNEGSYVTKFRGATHLAPGPHGVIAFCGGQRRRSGATLPEHGAGGVGQTVTPAVVRRHSEFKWVALNHGSPLHFPAKSKLRESSNLKILKLIALSHLPIASLILSNARNPQARATRALSTLVLACVLNLMGLHVAATRFVGGIFVPGTEESTRSRAFTWGRIYPSSPKGR